MSSLAVSDSPQSPEDMPFAAPCRTPETSVSTHKFAYMPRRASARQVREANPAIAVAMARMSDKAIGDAGRVEHSETYGLSH